MFSWICSRCGREVSPAYSECPNCASNSTMSVPSSATVANPEAAVHPRLLQSRWLRFVVYGFAVIGLALCANLGIRHLRSEIGTSTIELRNPLKVENLDGVHNAAISVKVAMEVGVSYLDFGPKLRQFATEVALAKEAGANSKAFEKYEAALSMYKSNYSLWGTLLTVNRYNVGNTLYAQGESSLQQGWVIAASDIEDATTLHDR